MNFLLLLQITLITNANAFIAFKAPCPSAYHHPTRLRIASSIDETTQLQQDAARQRSQQEEDNENQVNIVLVTGFESFNRDLYEKAGKLLPEEFGVNLKGACYWYLYCLLLRAVYCAAHYHPTNPINTIIYSFQPH